MEMVDGDCAKDDSTSMKLKQKDMHIFGVCPTQDEVYLAMCGLCHMAIKPQALQEHIRNRHPPDPKTYLNFEAVDHRSSGTTEPHRVGSVPTKASRKEPPQALLTRLRQTDNAFDLKKSASVPVVKVDRLPPSAIQKGVSVTPEREEPFSKPPLTNGTLRSLGGHSALAPNPPPPPLATHSPPVALAVQSTVSMTPITTMAASSSATILTTTATTTSTSVVSSVASSSSSSKKAATKTRKFLPCKDREFDPDKHCGCIIAETSKHCTRSLTCKTHALSLRRAVPGRTKPFDELLKEHRAAKEALQKAKTEGAAAKTAATAPPAHPPVLPPAAKTGPATSLHAKELGAAKMAAAMAHPPIAPQAKVAKPAPPRTPATITAFQKLVSGGVYTPTLNVKEEAGTVQMQEGVARFSCSSDADMEVEETPDHANATYINHQPRPLAMCGFGAKSCLNGYYTFSRKSENTCALFLNSFERTTHPPPHKKLCVESNLPKESQVPSFNSKDPYEFNMVDAAPHSSGNAATNVLNSAMNKAVVPKPKPSKTSTTGSTKAPVKAREGSTSSSGIRSPGVMGPATPVPNVSIPSSNRRKRSHSSSGNVVAPTPSSATPTPCSAPAPATTINIQNSAASSMPNLFPTAVSLNSHTGTVGGSPITFTTLHPGALTQLGTLSMGSKAGGTSGGHKLVLTTGVDSTTALINGQYINFSSSQLAGLTGSRVVAPVDDKSAKRARHSGGAKAAAVSGVKVAGGLLSSSVPQNAVILGSNFQGPLLASPVTLAGQPGKTIISIGGNIASSNAVSTSAIKPDSTPQVSISTLPNGVVSSSSGSSGRHGHPVKGNHSKTGPVMGQGALLQAAPAVSTPLGHLNVKTGTLNMTKNIGGRLTLQPMTMATLPIMQQASLVSQPGAMGHALLVSTTATTPADNNGAKPPSLPNS